MSARRRLGATWPKWQQEAWVWGRSWASRMGRPASRRRGRGQTRQELPGPLPSSGVPLGIHAAEARQRTQSVQGPRRTPGPCHLSGCALTQAPSCLAPAGTSPSCSCVCLLRAPKQKHLPTPRTSRCLLLPTAFFLTLSDAGQEWSWEERGWAGRDQGHSGGCREGHGTGKQGQQGALTAGGPRPRLLLLWPA